MPRAGLNSKGMGVAGEKINVELSRSRTPTEKSPLPEIVKRDPKVPLLKFKVKAELAF